MLFRSHEVTCTAPDCGRKSHAKNLCGTHYMKMIRTGTLMPLNAPRGGTRDERLRFKGWDVSDSGCWVVRGARKSGGYGAVQFEGGSRAAHRLAYEAWVGPIPEGLLIRHKCDNPPCINPEHLEPGTDADNNGDMMLRGRHRTLSGAKHPMSKLTWDEASAIRGAYATGVFTLNMLSEAFGVSRPTISRIVKGVGYSA